jgi:hypothetical protein
MDQEGLSLAVNCVSLHCKVRAGPDKPTALKGSAAPSRGPGTRYYGKVHGVYHCQWESEGALGMF